MSSSGKDRAGDVRPYPALSRPVLGSGRRGSLIDRDDHRGNPLLTLLGFVLAAFLGIYVALSFYMAITLTTPQRVPFEHTPDQYELTFEPVSFPSRMDSIQLDGWLLPVSGPARRPVVIVHGKGGDRQREVGGRVLEIAQALVRDGHPVLVFDLRGFGKSSGERFTLGGEEVRDVGGAIDFLDKRGLASKGVDLLGYSMGAATAMLAAAPDAKVSAVVEDSGYANLAEVLEDQVPKESGLPGFFTPGVVLAARVLTGVDGYAIRPSEAVQTLSSRGVPLMIIHGEADTTVPVSHGRRLVTIYGPKAESYFVPKAEHVASYQADPKTYLSKLTAFLDKIE